MIATFHEADQVEQEASFCQGLMYSVFQRPQLSTQSGGLVIALVAAHPGAGTTYLATHLTKSINSEQFISAVLLDCREAANSTRPSPEGRKGVPYPYEGAEGGAGLSAPREAWRKSFDYRASYLAHLRTRYNYVLIDCPSLKESTDVLGLTTLADGVLLVIEANKTTKSQIGLLERTIEAANGRILGHVLNKRTYLIPDRVHRKMIGWGF
jgi:cellulose biosynthesis protein BcsQ